MQKISNLKLNKSYKQKEDYIIALKSKKRVYLQNSDWTQLEDVFVQNREEIADWRKSLRDFKIDDNADHSTEAELDAIIASKPTIKHASATPSSNEMEGQLKNMVQEIEKLKEQASHKPNDAIAWLDHPSAVEKIKELFQQYKNKKLLDGGILEYSLTKLLLEEAVDKKFSASSDSDHSLLETNVENLDDIINDCKKYFKRINEIYMGLKKQEARLYNMSIKEINDWFIENGYRYRCKE